MSQPKYPITAGDIGHVLEVMARVADPQVAYRELDQLTQRALGHKLLTVLRYIEETAEVERLYSSNLQAGRKQKKGTLWGERVLDRGEIYIARGPEDIKDPFSDHELIFSLGVSSIMNVPILFGGRCLGTLNISHEAGRFTEADLPTARILAGLLVPLLHDSSWIAIPRG